MHFGMLGRGGSLLLDAAVDMGICSLLFDAPFGLTPLFFFLQLSHYLTHEQPTGTTQVARPASSALFAERRVVVTGMGITSCLGNTLEDVTKSLHECESGIEFDQEWADLGIKSNVRGRPQLTDAEFKEKIPKAHLRFMGKNAQYAYVAMQDAVADSGMTPEQYQENPRVCAILGQGGTSIPDIVETVDAVKNAKRWKNKVGPFRVTRSMGSTVSAVLATAFKVQGMSFSISR